MYNVKGLKVVQIFTQVGFFECVCLFDLILYVPSTTFQLCRDDLPGLNQYYARINVSSSKTQHSDAGEARTRGPLVSRQAFYHYATALP